MTTDAAEARALPMATAPKDGTMIRLLVDYTDGGAPLEDDHPRAWTIGFNSLDDTGEDEWKFAGWCWTHDHFTQGSGTPVGWLPWLNASREVFPQRIGRLSLGQRLSDGQDRQCAGGCEQQIPAGHAVYWPDRAGEYPDDIDPSCVSCAIAQAESDQGWCECQAFATAEAASGAGKRPSDDDLALHLPESIEAAKRCGIQSSDWLTGWFVPWSPRNDNQNAEGPWSDWVALARAILAADAKALAAFVAPPIIPATGEASHG